MALPSVKHLASELKVSYRKNQGDLRGLVFRHYPEFVLNPRLRVVEDQVIVFVFHDVEPTTFEQQLRYLTENGYHVLQSADALFQCVRGERQVKPQSVLLTFDDGRENLYTVAFPLLRRYGFHAVSFIVPSFVGERRFCTWDQIQEMHRSGIIDVQSHTLFHRFAPEWPRVIGCNGVKGGFQHMDQFPTMVEDYRRSREVIEERLDKPIRHLCYPSYDGTEASIVASNAAGYMSNFWGVIPGRKTNRKGDDPLRTVRVLDDYLLCLPGNGRQSLWDVAVRRVRQNGRLAVRRFLNRNHPVQEPMGCRR